MKQLKSNWNNLESVQHVGRVPKRGVSRSQSRQRRHVLIGTLGKEAALIAEYYDQVDRKRERFDY